jgi:hypothetical protein
MRYSQNHDYGQNTVILFLFGHQASLLILSIAVLRSILEFLYFLSNLSRTLFFFYFLSSSHLHPQDDEEEGEEGDESSAGDIELYNLDIINDTDDEDVEGENTEKNNITSGVTKSVSVVDSDKKEKKKDQKFFWDKESNEKASKTVNEEDDYKWEDEVRFRFVTVNLHKHYITLQ